MRLVNLMVAAGAAVLSAAFFAPPAAAQSTSNWEFDTTRRGGVAKTCVQLPRREVCAAVYCGRDGVIHMGLDGLSERINTERVATVKVGRIEQTVFFALQDSPRRGQRIWKAEVEDVSPYIRALKRGRDLDILIAPRRESIVFSLRGSSRAIEALEERCVEVVEAQLSPEVRYYRNSIVGTWGTRDLCRSGGWRFGLGELETPGGVKCEKLSFSRDRRGELTVSGAECARDGRARRDQRFELERAATGELLFTVAGSGDAPSVYRACPER